MISVYSKKTEIELNMRRLESIKKYNKLIQWGRANPTRFIELVFKIQLIDYQKWVILNTWTAEHAVWVCSRNAGKSFLGAVYMMARNLLFPKFETYIMSNTGFQAKDTFTKLENIVKKNISSLMGTSDVFFNEIVKSNANTDGFVHGNSQYELELYNGSKITSLVGKAENVVGHRSNLNFYDEAGKIDSHYFALTTPFTTQNINFKTGVGYDKRVYPLNIPTQNIYASSAESVDSYLWSQYCDCFKNMLMGIPGFFCADINCDLPLKPYLNGLPTGALLKQSEIDSALRTNESRALREYYNIFDTAGGNDAAVSRTSILKSEKNYLPLDRNEGNENEYVILFDPALQADNSFILIAYTYKDPEKGWKARVINGINLIEYVSPTQKKILRTPEQLEMLRRTLAAYNGHNTPYTKLNFYIDAGSGGAGRHYGDLLLSDFTLNGQTYPGIYDEDDENSRTQRNLRSATALPGLHLMEPVKFKSLMYGALSDMMSNELIDLPPALPVSGEIEIDGELKQLTTEEKRALIEIDLMKEEVMSIQKYKTQAGNIIYKLPPSKERRMHDDRAYCLAMLGWHLFEKRKEDFDKIPVEKFDYSEYLLKMQDQKGRKDEFLNKTKSLHFGTRR